jgi:hypothetical protein
MACVDPFDPQSRNPNSHNHLLLYHPSSPHHTSSSYHSTSPCDLLPTTTDSNLDFLTSTIFPVSPISPHSSSPSALILPHHSTASSTPPYFLAFSTTTFLPPHHSSSLVPNHNITLLLSLTSLPTHSTTLLTLTSPATEGDTPTPQLSVKVISQRHHC